MNLKRSKAWRHYLLAALLSVGLVVPATTSAALASEDVSAVESGAPALMASQQIESSVSVACVADDGTVHFWATDVTNSLEIGSSGWDAVKGALNLIKAKGGNYVATETEYGIYVSSITNSDNTTLVNTTSEPYYYWEFIVNGEPATVSMDKYPLHDGDKIMLFYNTSDSYVQTKAVDADDLTAVVPNVSAEWPTFMYNDNLTSYATPTRVGVSWKTLVGGGATVSEPVLVGDKIYVAVGSSFMGGEVSSQHTQELLCLNKTTGAIEASTPLSGNLSYTVRPTYYNGLLYIPLDGGSVQAVNVSTMKTRWVSAATSGQASTSLKVLTGVMPTVEGSTTTSTTTSASTSSSSADSTSGLSAAATATPTYDVLFSGTATYGDNGYTSGSLTAIDPVSGARINALSFDVEGAGLYWTNTVSVNGFAITGTTAGTLTTVAATPEARKTLELGSAINADLALYGNKIVVVTRDGVLHEVEVASDGTLTEYGKVSAVGGCTAGATIVGTQAIVAGQDGTIAIVDLDTLTVNKVISSVDGQPISGPFASSVLASQQGDTIICYVTLNNATDPNETYTSYGAGGHTYFFILGSDTEAHKLWSPDAEQANYCDSPLIADSEGSLYYLNDSGYVVKLAKIVSTTTTAATTTTTTTTTTAVNRTSTATTSTSRTSTAKEEALAETGDQTLSVVAIVALAVALLGAGFGIRMRRGSSKQTK